MKNSYYIIDKNIINKTLRKYYIKDDIDISETLNSQIVIDNNNFTLNNTICVPCSPGTFNNALGRTNCTTCNSGETSESGATVCFSCAIGKLEASRCILQ